MTDPRFDSEFIERIVREVIRRLLERGATVAPAGSVSSSAAAAANGSTELMLTGKLVTLETVRDRLGGIQRITVGRRTIVTPAVRDELKQRKIKLERQDS